MLHTIRMVSSAYCSTDRPAMYTQCIAAGNFRASASASRPAKVTTACKSRHDMHCVNLSDHIVHKAVVISKSEEMSSACHRMLWQHLNLYLYCRMRLEPEPLVYCCNCCAQLTAPCLLALLLTEHCCCFCSRLHCLQRTCGLL